MDTTITGITSGSVPTQRPVTLVPGLGRVLMEPAASNTIRVGDGMAATIDTYTVGATTHYTVTWEVGR